VRLVRFADDRTGALAEGPSGTVVVDLAAAPEWPEVDLRGWAALIEDWARLGPVLAAFVADRAASPPDGRTVHDVRSVRLRAPLPAPTSRIFALGVNFRSHVAGAAKAVGQADATKDDTRPPAGFFVIPGSVVGPDEEVCPPPDAQKLDYEAEVAVVLATGGRDLAPEDVRFWGHTGFNDVSIRDPHLGLSRLDEGALAWGLQKNFYGGNVLGPWVAVGEGHDLAALRIRSSVNGELRQDGSTAEMIRSFAEGVAYLSRYLPLAPGDLLTSGTPAGTAIEQGIDGPFLRPGDVMEVEVEGAGTLRNRVGGTPSAKRMVEPT
jgi:2-keto-4-pentenoate hydratase/2-oxohepta-3-ene-1,7-dioic acid hydratase in catechol pathway